ncbi:MAG: GDSL-type esterase/lipase family protein [Bacteroidota bacterium]
MIERVQVLFLMFFLLISCEKDEGSIGSENEISTSINKIMPLGASRVEGARPDYESYRYELWKMLKDGGWTFDFIGTLDDEAAYPDYNGQSFDEDHEGRGGWTSGQIASGISTWFEQTGAPDIVLFSSPGGNDGLQNLSFDEALVNINSTIDYIQSANPNVTIIIEQLAPAHSDIMTQDLMNYLSQMQEAVTAIANAQTTSSSQVIAIDMFTGFSDDLLADDVHYNGNGAKFIAERYYGVLANVLEK